MNKRILIITDKLDSCIINEAIRNKENDSGYDILSLSLDKEANIYLNENKFSKIESLHVVDASLFSESIRGDIREYIKSLLYRLPREEFIPNTSIFKLLQRRRFNLWWFLEMSEKSIKTPFTKRIYSFEIIRRTISNKPYQELWVELEDKEITTLLRRNSRKLPPLRFFGASKAGIGKSLGEYIRELFWIRLFINMARTQISCFFRYLVIKLTGLGNDFDLKKNSVVFFSSFPYFWSKSKDSGLIEIFYRNLPVKIKELTPAYFDVWLTTLGPCKLWSDRRKIRENFKEMNIKALESHLTLRDFISNGFFSIGYILTLINYYFRFRPGVREYYHDYDVTNIVTADLNNSLTSLVVFDCKLLMMCCERLARNNKLSALIYRMELQAIEKAVLYGVNRHTLTVAFQHNAFSKDHLQYFFHPDEIENIRRNNAHPNQMPLPDKFLVTGEYAFEVLRGNGIAAGDIGICGPVRYPALREYDKVRPTRDHLRDKYGLKDQNHIFLITFSYEKGSAINLMISLLQAVKDIASDALFLIKSHPLFKFEGQVVDIIRKIRPSLKYKILPDEINLYDYLALCDALILTPSTVGIEAIGLGVVPILFQINSLFSINHLLEVKDACLFTRTVPELKEAISSVIKDDEKIKEIRKNRPNAIKKLFYSLKEDADDKFCGYLKEYAVFQ